jgi:hypothetical protein
LYQENANMCYYIRIVLFQQQKATISVNSQQFQLTVQQFQLTVPALAVVLVTLRDPSGWRRLPLPAP